MQPYIFNWEGQILSIVGIDIQNLFTNLSLEFSPDPLDGFSFGDLMIETDGAPLPLLAGDTETCTAEYNVEVHTCDRHSSVVQATHT